MTQRWQLHPDPDLAAVPELLTDLVVRGLGGAPISSTRIEPRLSTAPTQTPPTPTRSSHRA